MVGVSKSTWYYAQRKQSYEERYSYLREPLMEIAEQHPEYGYRRTTSELHDRGLWINHKVVEKLHQLWYLSIRKGIKPGKPNPIRRILKEAGSAINLVSQLKEIEDLEVLYTDFTEIVYQRGQAKAQFMPIIVKGKVKIPSLGESNFTHPW